ncbi:heme ABC exporter ATP-binding protein CcmA [Marinihelvus fidelis]|uniref:Heme ABC exporter ATP-binding protein CcmA n=1 Tax=Marinihelvus fidelis TaxID=2613842 RepID=A0A5N0T732_9GAMM|nr:heme ABC exporter ATP-binding protein CcmA [Marinihelvus fidelis]KAA9130568.1 heme ABC exporter ATP-binding protein CcmA [Marinihelvus fidelis]
MLQATHLTLERHFHPVFAPVDLDVAAGELWVLTGANGSGKTTLLRLLAGLGAPSSGHVTRRVATAWIGHRLALKDDLDVLENLRLARDFAGSPTADLQAAAERVGLAAATRQMAGTLSAGQRKRCALARLLLAPASLWLLDEPYANLDREGAAMLDGLLAAHLASGGACVMSTHGDLKPAIAGFRELAIRPAEADA